ncbi:MAG: KTSC domain-containing protein [Patescibacteria group bacterium]
MYRTSVNSTNITSIGYDAPSSVLEVEFTSGEVYQYFNVPEYLYQQFVNAPSHGQFLNEHIRYQYRYQKVG